MCVEDREPLEHVPGDVWLSPPLSFVDMWAVENKTLEEWPGSFAEVSPVWSVVQGQLKMKLFSRFWVLIDSHAGSLFGSHKKRDGSNPRCAD